MSKEAAYKTLYSLTVFLIVFSILNFYIRQMKEEKAWRLKQEKLKEIKKFQLLNEKIVMAKKLKFLEEFFYCKSNQKYENVCNVSEVFLLIK